VHLCLDPKKVYKNTSYHKQTKNQWARDDPAFTVLSALFLLVAAVAYAVSFQVSNPLTFLRVVFGTVLFDFVLVGSVLATLTWAVANRYLRVQSLHSVEQEVPPAAPAPSLGGHSAPPAPARPQPPAGPRPRTLTGRACTAAGQVEWMYAWDIHCNSFFPLFLALYVAQFFALPFLMAPGFLPCLASNTLFLAALTYYHYLTFLGYSALPFVRDAVYFLYPVGALAILYVISLLLHINCTLLALGMYFSEPGAATG
jgi:hypothetical protein